MESCIFCRVISGDIPAKIVYQDEQVVAIEDIAPIAPVHILIIPRKHFENALDLESEDNELIGHLFQTAAHIARDKGIAEQGFRIVNNNNAGAGQSVFHIHFHLIGGRPLTWPPG